MGVTGELPVGSAFHMPDPALSAWHKSDRKLKKKGMPKSLRPSKLARNNAYPTMPQIALALLAQFKQAHEQIRIRCIAADALYGTQAFMDQASNLFGGIQVISQIRHNQLIRFRNRKMSLTD